jgi:hypothetical protein
MEVITEHIKISTKGNSEVVDITAEIAEKIRHCGLQEGIVTVFVSGSTASITTTDYGKIFRKRSNISPRRISDTITTTPGATATVTHTCALLSLDRP